MWLLPVTFINVLDFIFQNSVSLKTVYFRHLKSFYYLQQLIGDVCYI